MPGTRELPIWTAALISVASAALALGGALIGYTLEGDVHQDAKHSIGGLLGGFVIAAAVMVASFLALRLLVYFAAKPAYAATSNWVWWILIGIVCAPILAILCATVLR